MKVIGFGFNKLSSQKFDAYKQGTNKTTNIEITNVEKEDLPFESKNDNYKISFKFEVLYSNPESKKENKVGEVVIEGSLNILLENENSKDLVKSWKKKELSNAVKQPLFNMILRKCSIRAISLEEEVGLPSHIPIPQIKIAPKKE